MLIGILWQGSFSGTMQPSPKVPISLYAPHIVSISESSLVSHGDMEALKMSEC